MIVANPIYDIVFKYLMEDERIARITKRTQQMLDLDDDLYPEDDVEMQRIVRRLLMAASDPDMRMDMNVEDEYYSIIEKQDTDLNS